METPKANYLWFALTTLKWPNKTELGLYKWDASLLGKNCPTCFFVEVTKANFKPLRVWPPSTKRVACCSDFIPFWNFFCALYYNAHVLGQFPTLIKGEPDIMRNTSIKIIPLNNILAWLSVNGDHKKRQNWTDDTLCNLH